MSSANHQVQLCKVSAFGSEFHLHVENTQDLIQRHFLRGELYEQEELQIIKHYSAGCQVYYDIGANVGNHALFMAKVLRASKVHVFEANVRAANLLKLNVERNGLEGIIDTSKTGLGIGAKSEKRSVFNPQVNNLGAARLRNASHGERAEGGYFSAVDVVSLDSLRLPEPPDFVKIDVEGMEMKVLAGMTEVIAVARPRMFLEVNHSNREAFLNWIAISRYSVVDAFSRYESNMNFMIAPREADGSVASIKMTYSVELHQISGLVPSHQTSSSVVIARRIVVDAVNSGAAKHGEIFTAWGKSIFRFPDVACV